MRNSGQEYFCWRASEETPPVAIARRVIDDIRREVLDRFQPPLRGEEIAGMLLGSRDRDSGEFVIEAYRPVTSEDLPGWRTTVAATYAVGAGSPFIGIYRSQTGPGLRISPGDCELVETTLPRQEGVLLLVKPLSATECVASFFLCDGGVIVDEAAGTREFPFGSAPVPPVPEATAPQKTRRFARWLVPASAIAIGMLLAAGLHSTKPDTFDEAPAAVLTPSPAAPPQISPAASLTPPTLPINSSSGKDVEKPSPLIDTSAATEVNQPPVGSEVVHPRYIVTRGNVNPQPTKRGSSRAKRFFGAVSSKATHLWPFHSAKQEVSRR